MSDEAQRARVLVVDDDRLARELVREVLEQSVRVECCRDAEEALAALRREPAELVLSDLTMPGLSGLDLLTQVRRDHPGTDFVMLTANASVESAVEALRMGAADYLRKPIDVQELTLVVQRTLARRRLVEENGRLRDLLATLEACRALAPCLEPGEVYPVALDLLLHTLGRTRGLALFHRPSLAVTDAVAFRGFSEAEQTRLRGALVQEKGIDFEGVTKVEVIAKGTLHDALREAGVELSPLLVVPVRGSDTEAGVLWIFEDGRPFDVSELERARIVLGHAALALQNAERFNQAKERAFVDDVTELHNARYLLAATDHEIVRAKRYGSELSVLFLDLDRFKLVNDRHGHLVGSRALRQLARVLTQCVRQVDTLARYGGDEFTVLLVDTGVEGAHSVAERIRRTVEETPFEGARGSGPLALSVSVGISNYPVHGRTREALLDAADKAMYRAKSMGRNRVCSASDLKT